VRASQCSIRHWSDWAKVTAAPHPRLLAHVELGFRPEHVLVLSVDPTLIGYDGERIATLYKRLLEQLEAIPSVLGSPERFLGAYHPVFRK